jgi:hypothetical protein
MTLTSVTPSVTATATAVAPVGSPQSSGSTSPSMAVKDGDSVYVFIAYNNVGGTLVKSVTDNAVSPNQATPNVYKKAAITLGPGNVGGPAPSIEVWYADGVPPHASLEVTVTFTASTLFAVIAADISGAAGSGSLDAVSVGASANGTPTSSTDSVTSVYQDDIIFSVQCQVYGSGTVSAGGGFTSVLATQSGTTVGSDLGISVWEQGVGAPSSETVTLSWPTGEPYALRTVAVRSAIAWSNLAGKPYVTVSPAGITGGLSSLNNAGADFGPDTPGSNTVGIQEALNFASANGINRVCLLSGLFSIKAGIMWPSGWGGILEGNGSARTASNAPASGVTLVETDASFPTGTLDMLDLNGADVYGFTIRDIYFLYSLSGTSATSVVNLGQATDSRHSVRVERCDFDAGTNSTHGFVSLIMDHNQGSTLDQVNCWSPLNTNQFGLQWKTPGGGVKIFGGTYDGMNLAPQVAGLYSVTTNHKITVSGGNSPVITLVDHYRNPNDTSPIVLNQCGTAVTLIVLGGWLYLQNAGSIFPVFFDSGASADSYSLTIDGTVLIGGGGSTPNTLFSTTAASQLYVLAPVLLQSNATLDSTASLTGVGLPGVLGLDNRTGRTAADGSKIPIATSPTGYTSLIRVSVAVTTVGGAATTFTYTISWTDENGNSQSVSATGSAAAMGTTISNTALAHVETATSVQVQLVAVSGTGAKVDLAASVELLQ